MPAQAVELTPVSFELRGVERVGAYAIALTWGDGHNSGIFAWGLLRVLGS